MDALSWEKCRRQLIRHEGLCLRLYHCTAGKPTIGVGHNIEAHPLPPKFNGRDLVNAGITENEAMELLDADMRVCEAQLLKRIPAIYNSLNDARQAVLLNMAFNMGVDGLLGFKNSLRMIGNGLYSEAAENMKKSIWYREVGHRSHEMCEQMRTGVWQ